MKILGIDPGSRKAGYALLHLEGRSIELIASGVLRYDGISEFLHRLSYIYETCSNLVEKTSPNEIAIESLIYVKSVPALSKLAQARGAMIAGLTSTGCKSIFEYSPNLIKSTVSGYGHADKQSIHKTLSLLFRKNLSVQSHDESDALAIAVCHALSRTAKVKYVQNQKRSVECL